MLTIVIPPKEFWDEAKGEFVKIGDKDVTLQLEHSLIALSKWESKWKVPFLEKNPPKTNEMTIDYIRCMTITKNVPPDVYDRIPNPLYTDILNYIKDPMTATWFGSAPTPQGKQKAKPEVLTAEVIYYKMISHNIPMECQKWHLNSLITLIRVFNNKNSKPTKMNKKEMLAQRKALNESRRSAAKSKG